MEPVETSLIFQIHRDGDKFILDKLGQGLFATSSVRWPNMTKDQIIKYISLCMDAFEKDRPDDQSR